MSLEKYRGHRKKRSNRNSTRNTSLTPRGKERRLILAGGGAALLVGAAEVTGLINLIPNKQEASGKSPRIEYERLDIIQIATNAVDKYNRVLKRNVDVDSFVESVKLINTSEELRPYLPPGDEPDYKIAVTLEDESRNIFVVKEVLDTVFVNVPKDKLGDRAKADLLEQVLLHELVHSDGSIYKSQELHEIVWNKLFTNDFSHKETMIGDVIGAEIKATVLENGEPKVISAFQDLEESEAEIISDLVLNKTRKEELADRIPPTNQNSYVLLNDLLGKLNGSYDDNVQLLAKLRNEIGGREKWAIAVGNNFGIDQSEVLHFSMSLFYAIDRGDKQLYEYIISRSETSIKEVQIVNSVNRNYFLDNQYII